MQQPDISCTESRVLLVDDNRVFRGTLARALHNRGWVVDEAANAVEALGIAVARPPRRALVDLNLGERASGLHLIPRLLEVDAAMRIVVLTGYASIATAVEAVHLGATHYLAKPAEVDEILGAFVTTRGDPAIPLETQPMCVEQMEWEYIQRKLVEHDWNLSATARALNLHRRSLQRKLGKHACW